MSITVLDPTNEPIKTAFEMAPRPERLKGLTLGLIDNGKKNSDYLVRKIGDRLRELHGLKEGIHVKKPSPSHAIPTDSARELAEKSNLVLGRYRGLRFLQLGQCARRNRHGKTGRTHRGYLYGTIYFFRKGHGRGSRFSRISVCCYSSSH